jgi:hypothetical protein
MKPVLNSMPIFEAVGATVPWKCRMLSWKSIALSSAVPLPRIGVVPRGRKETNSCWHEFGCRAALERFVGDSICMRQRAFFSLFCTFYSCFPGFPLPLAEQSTPEIQGVRRASLTGEQSDVKLECTIGHATINACCTFQSLKG